MTAYRLQLKTNRVKYTDMKLRDMQRKQEERASECEKMSEMSELERERMIELRKKERKDYGKSITPIIRAEVKMPYVDKDIG